MTSAQMQSEKTTWCLKDHLSKRYLKDMNSTQVNVTWNLYHLYRPNGQIHRIQLISLEDKH
jgi:hypothetical protein